MALDDIMRQALEITRSQAAVRPMSAAEAAAYAAELAQRIQVLGSAKQQTALPGQKPACNPDKSIREAAVTCLECGKVFKVLGKRHLAGHGLTAETYRKKWGLKPDQPLMCRALVRQRRRTMSENKVWEKAVSTPQPEAVEE